MALAEVFGERSGRAFVQVHEGKKLRNKELMCEGPIVPTRSIDEES